MKYIKDIAGAATPAGKEHKKILGEIKSELLSNPFGNLKLVYNTYYQATGLEASGANVAAVLDMLVPLERNFAWDTQNHVVWVLNKIFPAMAHFGVPDKTPLPSPLDDESVDRVIALLQDIGFGAHSGLTRDMIRSALRIVSKRKIFQKSGGEFPSAK